jgi:hypothetical protein
MSASLLDPLDRLRVLIERALDESDVPQAALEVDQAAKVGYRAGLQRALELVKQTDREQRAIEEQMRNGPPGTVY